MSTFFKPNIDARGRLARAIWGLLLLGAAYFAYGWQSWVAWVLIASAVFAFYEALRRWCVLRACGIKTKF